ncbi:MAG TPA: hypothetical protein VFJ94_01645 [Intrasporangium sp.]|uniref:hypothetical protein n=1 Tax=Intrasporangium sp. TaxID=1925024 RepID=UPI002D77775C|nr:hypothetical protein [Intrasporangium sp.]HET7397197.1 hypothetical protein [Intrasporangium sp.]
MSGSGAPPKMRPASHAPLARGALLAAATGLVLGFCFVPQLLGLALGGLSLVREPGARRPALLAIAASLALTAGWGAGLGLLVKWWASSRI